MIYHSSYIVVEGLYLQFLSALSNILPTRTLELPLPRDSQTPPAPWVDDSDSDYGHPTTIIASRPPLPPLDSRTRKRLQILPSLTRINTLSP